MVRRVLNRAHRHLVDELDVIKVLDEIKKRNLFTELDVQEVLVSIVDVYVYCR